MRVRCVALAALAVVASACGGQVATTGTGEGKAGAGTSGQLNAWQDAGPSPQENAWSDAAPSPQENSWADGGGPNPFNGGW